MGRRAAIVTQADISRAVRAIRDVGLPIVRVRVLPDGEVIVETVEAPPQVAERPEEQDAGRIIYL